MAFNTGNPLGSTDPRDLSDNSENFDGAVNSTNAFWTDRFGVSRPTIPSALDSLTATSYRTFGSISFMVADADLAVGHVVSTTGGVASGDGDGNDYEIVAGGTGTADGKYFIDLANGLQAKAISQSLNMRKKTSNKQQIVILTTGQSNMVGSSNILQGDTSTDPRVFAWNARVGETGTALVTATLGQAPFNGGGQQHIGFNAAKYMAQMMDIPIYIINLASGGQNIDRWIATDATPTLWDAITTEVPAALAAIGTDTVDYVMWHQGEANAADDVISYRNKLRTVKGQMESETWFDAGFSRMIVGGLAIGLPTTGTSGANDSMNLGLDLFAETDAEVATVPTYDLEIDSTGIHFLDNSIIEIGKRYAKTAMYPAPYSSRISAKRVIDGNVNFVIDAAAVDNFTGITEFLHFAGTLTLTPNARVDVEIKPGQYLVDASPRLSIDGTFFRFFGTLDGAFTAPVKADFSPEGAPDEAADLAMLRGKYLTEIQIPGNVGLVLGGNSAGYWQDLLLYNPAPTLSSAAIRSSDPSLFTPDGGEIALRNCAIHGWNGTNNKVVDATGNCHISINTCVASHCTVGVVAINSRVSTQSALFAHCGNAANASKLGFIDAFNLQILAPGATSYTANVGSYIFASGADDNLSTSTASGGVVVT